MAVLFAVALVPLLAFTGFALDYARASLGRTQLQAATDAAGLAVAHLPRTTLLSEVEKHASDWVKASLEGRGLGPITVKAEKNGTRITFTASSTINNTLFKILRDEPTPIAAVSEVSWDLGKIEVALVLDNTGSMTQNNSPKLKNLKDAATSLVNQLEQAAARPDQVKVGVVPFSMTVNVGSQYADASWMDTKGKSPINKEIFNGNANRFELLKKMAVSWGGCVESRPSPHDVEETEPTSSDPETLYVPYFAPDEPDKGGTAYNNYLDDAMPNPAVANWKERQGHLNKYNGAPRAGTNPWTGYKYGPNAGCALQPLQRLTTQMSTVRSMIRDMTAVGDTNIPIGLMWGWHVLSPNGPFRDGAAYDTRNLTKFVILMTDGDNRNTPVNNPNESFYSGVGYIWQGRLGITGGQDWQRERAMDDRLETLCSNIKATGIQVFTVRVEVNSGSSSLLKNCATSKDMFYNVTDSGDLTSVFSRIGDKITQLRLSK